MSIWYFAKKSKSTCYRRRIQAFCGYCSVFSGRFCRFCVDQYRAMLGGIVGIIFITVLFFGLGLGIWRLTGIDADEKHSGMSMMFANNTGQIDTISTRSSAGGMYVASEHGTRFFLPWCSEALRLNPGQKRWFVSVAKAEEAGLRPAKNCPGMAEK